MNLVTAEKMLVLLEQSTPEGLEDDAYFIVQRLLKAELRKGNDAVVAQTSEAEFLLPTRAELTMWNLGHSSNKVHAMRAYRDRTGSGLYHAKKALEAGVALRFDPEVEHISSLVTSCG